MKRFSKLLPALQKKLVIPIVSVVALLAFVGLLTYQVTKAEVTVNDDGEVTTVRTHADTVDALLQELNIEVEDHDYLSHAKDDLIQSEMKINYEKAKQVIVTVDGVNEPYYTTADTVGEFLVEKELETSQYDQLSAAEEDAIEDGLSITINKAYQVTILDAGEESKVWTTGGTVGDLLAKNDIKLEELDRLEPEKSKRLSKESTIEITRVEKVTDVVEETIDYSVVKKNDQSLDKGKEKVVAAGQEGMVEKHYEVIIENGEEVSRELVKEEVVKESEQRVVAVGTKAAPKPTPQVTVSRSGDGEAVKTLTMHATAYNWDCASCSGRGFTATGYNLKANPNEKVVAVDPNVIPLGTRVWVEGYGYAIARDTGGAIKGNRIDIHLPTLAQASSYGRKTVKVKILD
ncbi:ubiquitin-like domain-containing protein [Aquibacillus koreensis]|uniref:Ubiquitin-like domain-containing protein n=1 Tax=Aquibacillus koreensis TaxID=279446 RepID=A0A9X3WMC6_9BACI|nr:G5 and 3D domain-containing protein [Aquibacillus koreensis]MCT2534325.1 ubiquitin-like domain-containing protein [Aquibacillus koreensis]MDC3422402.1 ubiquitin-like domain-containing protein [Aquibacillus koreensis]